MTKSKLLSDLRYCEESLHRIIEYADRKYKELRKRYENFKRYMNSPVDVYGREIEV